MLVESTKESSMKVFNNPYMWSAFLTVSLSASPSGVLAAPGAISDSPLFLSAAVQPNIFFLVDDSGSMFWDGLLNNGTFSPGSAIYSTVPRPASTGTGSIDWLQRRMSCRGFNVMAYDPSVTYTPWAGVDSAGNAYTNQSLTSARRDPYSPSTAENISNHVYFTWTDADADGQYDGPAAGDYRLGGASAPNPATDECGDVSSNANGTTVSALATTAQKTNYANWFSYYRSRQHVAKKALAEIVSNSTSRVGLGTLHNNNNVGTAIKDVDDLTLPINGSAQTNKAALMRQLFRVRPSGGTPLRQSLRNAGNYFKGSTAQGNLFGGSALSDPILPAAQGGSCQQNFTILMSDGTWNGSSPSVGNTDIDGTGPWDGGAYADSASNTLADVAMKYYEEDLDSSLLPEVPVNPVDSNTDQHMVTYTVAFGVNGTLPAAADPTSAGFTWPTPTSNSITTIDDMRHAAYNGRGEFLSAGDPQQLITSLGAAISNIQSRSGTAAAVSLNSTSVQGNTKVFRASFDSVGWHGNLEALSLTSAGVLTTPPVWDAASSLNTRILAGNARKIATFNGTKGVIFNWPTNYGTGGLTGLGTGGLNSAQVSDLLSHTDAPFPANTAVPAERAANQAFGQNILAYHRGDFTNEGTSTGQFRARNGHYLGDIVHAGPVFVAEPNTAYPDALEGSTNLYSTFKATQATRPARVYAGANDGMLHVFNAVDGSASAGEEVFSYIPGLVFSSNSGKGLHSLAEQGYSHNYYVDLTPAVADVFIEIGGLPAAWKTVLVGGLRAGGKGIFALDITDPTILVTETDVANNVPLWEFTHPDLGFTFSEIQIARLHNGKWAAIFGNGYNNDPTGDGRAKLFIHYLDGSGTVILDTQAGSMVSNSCSHVDSDCNGLSTPALADLNGDAIIDRAYAGDLQGNLWVFDLTDTTPFNISTPNASNWGFAYTDGSGNPSPLFQACTSATCTTTSPGGITVAANRQPITSKPTLARHPNRNSSGTAPNILAYIGTGQYLTTSDNASAAPQSFYGVWDGGTFGITPRTSPLTRSNLVSQTISTPVTPTQRILTTNTVNYNPAASPPSTPEYGWIIDLPVNKERVIVDSFVIGDIMFFNTLIPSTSACSGGGSGFLMTVNMINGGQPAFSVIDNNNDGDFSNDPILGGQYVGNATTASRFINNGAGRFIQLTGAGSSTLAQGGRGNEGTAARRISWRHLDY